ncbi:MAG: Recombinase [Firmicutes bacterium]|nr:Recombinase [Bacillota bacterium]
MELLNRAAIYARYSSDKQRTESAEAQLQAGRVYCDKNKYIMVKEYVDEAETGKNDNREAFQQMLADAANGLFDVLIVHKVDRFARNREDAAFNRRKLKKAKVKIEYVDQNIDGSPESVILESVLEGMAEYYSKNLARETMKGLLMNAQKAQFNGGTPPIGYDVDTNKHYIINEKEAPIVRLIFQMFLDGYGYGKISDELHLRGFHTKRGGKFAKNSLHDILNNPKYIGVYTFGKISKTEDGTRNTHSNNPDMLTKENAIPPIIDKQTWALVRNKMAENKKAPGRFKAKRVYLLSGLLFCGECGSALIGTTSKPRGIEYSFYSCGGKARKSISCSGGYIPKEVLEYKVIDFICNYILNPKNAEKLVEQLNTHTKEHSITLVNEITSLENEKKQIVKKIDNLLDMVEDGLCSEKLKDRLTENETRLSWINNRLKELFLRSQRLSISPDQISEVLNDFRTILQEKGSPEKMKAVLNTLVQKIVVKDKKQVSIDIDVPVRFWLVPRTGIEPVRVFPPDGF